MPPALSSARLTGPPVLATERTARDVSRLRYLTVLLVVLVAVPLMSSLAVSVGAVWIPPGG